MRSACCLAFVATGACKSASATAVVTAYGEEFIEEGIPAEAVDDAWAISFERFEVTLREIRIDGVELAGTHVVDLSESSRGAGHELGTLELENPGEEAPTFVIARLDISGSARMGDEEKTFSWVFANEVVYDECETTTEPSESERATFQITVHADHLFYDSLVAEEPRLLFQPLADADHDDDGNIEQAELAETDIGAYDPGSAGGIANLWAFLEAQAATLGHVDGEGHCRSSLSD